MSTKEQRKGYRKICKRIFGRDIADKKSLEQAVRTLEFIQIACEPMTKKENEEREKRRERG